jgi:hypothetical protein
MSAAPPVQAQPVATINLPAPGAAKQLYSGCNNVAVTFPDGTTSATVLQAVNPAGAVDTMWRHSAALNAFEGYSAQFPQASDLLTVNFMDAVWLCMAEGLSAIGPAQPPSGVSFIELDVLSIDISKAPLSGPPGSDNYFASYLVYDPADMMNQVCRLDSPGTLLTASDPPSSGVGFNCQVQGSDVILHVIVQVQVASGQAMYHAMSAAAFTWNAPGAADWQYVTLDSKDAFVPPLDGGTDDPGLEFTVDIRFRSI